MWDLSFPFSPSDSVYVSFPSHLLLLSLEELPLIFSPSALPYLTCSPFHTPDLHYPSHPLWVATLQLGLAGGVDMRLPPRGEAAAAAAAVAAARLPLSVCVF